MASADLSVKDITVYVVSPLTLRRFRPYFEHAELLENLLFEQHRHRHEMFVDFMGWRSRNIQTHTQIALDTGEIFNIECDAFDKDNAIYSIAVDPDFNFMGSTRAASTMLPTMLEDDEFKKSFYPGLQPVKDYSVFEGTRIISPNAKLYEGTRQINRVKGGVAMPLLYSHLEMSEDLGFTGSVGTMPPVLQEKTYGRMGLPYHHLGHAVTIKDDEGHELDEGVPTQAYFYKVNPEINAQVRQVMGKRISAELGEEYQVPERMNNYGVPDDVLPGVIQHMKENLHNGNHPHRIETDLSPETRRVKPMTKAKAPEEMRFAL